MPTATTPTAYDKSALVYDSFYEFKDYAAEVDMIHSLIQRHKQTSGANLLDVACGTGHHIRYLSKLYTCEGIDLNEAMLTVARERLPDVPFQHGDMVSFDVGRSFDVVTCLFSAIGYVKTVDKLNQAIRTMARHIRPGGVLIVEPWFAPGQFFPDKIHGRLVEKENLLIARMNTSVIEEGVSVMDMHYLIGTPSGVEHFVERHELGLFTHEQHMAALEACGLQVHYDPIGLMNRGLYLGVKAPV